MSNKKANKKRGKKRKEWPRSVGKFKTIRKNKCHVE